MHGDDEAHYEHVIAPLSKLIQRSPITDRLRDTAVGPVRLLDVANSIQGIEQGKVVANLSLKL